MFAIFCRRRLRVSPKDCVFQNPVLIKSCTSSVCENASEKSFTVSYLINSCGLSSNDAIIASKNLCFKSPENPDSVLELLRKYGFTNAHIPKLVTKRPSILLACPNKTLLPKLDFFRSIGVPLPVLAHKVSSYPAILMRSLEKSIIPMYNDLKDVLRSDEGVVRVFSRAPVAFARVRPEGIAGNFSILRDRGVPESSIVSLVVCKPAFLIINKEKLAEHVDRAVGMGFDISKRAFVHAIQAFFDSTESTLKHKMDVYRQYGWSESDIVAAFIGYPNCLKLSEKKIMANMDFLVEKYGLKNDAIVRCPVVLGYSLEKRIKPRWLVARILIEKGLKKKVAGLSLLGMSEEKFLEKYIDKYKKDIPELLDIYRGNLSPSDIGFGQVVISK